MADKKQIMTWEEFAKQYPEYFAKPKKKKNDSTMRFLCQCKSGHVFDYRKRKRYPKDNPHFAPCQGLCPICGDTFSFIGNGENIYPIKWNFLS